MKMQIAHVDLSALGALDRVRAATALRRAIDPHYRLRIRMGESVAPAEIQVAKIAPGLLQLTKVAA